MDAEICGYTYVEVETLPPGPGVLPEEVGTLGPWFGIQFIDGTVKGWAKDKVQLNCLLNDEPWREHARRLYRERKKS